MSHDIDIHPLQAAVQKNCDISDAHFAGDYTMCVYLLKMREYYRWQQGIELGAPIAVAEIGTWVQARESEFDALVDTGLSDLEFAGCTFDPFESDRLNQLLIDRDLVYSAGYGRFLKPYFVLAELIQVDHIDGCEVLICGEEYARELVAPPAMSRDRTIHIRKQSLRRALWEMIEEWRWQKRDNALKRALSYYDFDQDMVTALDQMTDREIHTLVQHEIGEVLAGELVGNDWNKMLASMAQTDAENMARAVRDHLADCIRVLPSLLDGKKAASIHMYIANLGATRAQLFPNLKQAYQRWIDRRDIRPLRTAVEQGRDHWLSVASAVMTTYARHGDGSAPYIEDLIADSCL